MPHEIQTHLVENLSKGPSASKITQVSSMQNYIRDLLGDTHFTFLQGSYRNDTAVSDINDVDIVAVKESTLSGTHSPYRHESNETIFWDSIFEEIENKLKDQELYNWTIKRDNKCIKIRGAFNADVTPAVKYHRVATSDPIVIFSWDNRKEQVSHPREHITNSTTKHELTDKNYKPLVRLFKNWARNNFDKGVVSSFKLQALVHSADNNNFPNDMVAGFILVGNHIISTLDAMYPSVISVCGNEDIIDSWDMRSRTIFLNQLRKSVDLANKAYSAHTLFDAELNWRLAMKI